ncbi:low-density lipoprotein receptor-related protein 1B-like [Ptychodera flava]|uniref:low-density lipoprotein receptor-related protein 1B-like n=1 Tax=Ptychodera flava TaxID=63121 RepID=UPI00396A6CC8
MFAQFLLLALLSALQVIGAVGIPRTDNHLIKPFIEKVDPQARTNHQNDIGLKVDFLRQGIVKREVSNGIEKDALCGIVYPDYPYICADRSWCLAVSQICDDVISCYDGSDEEGCQDDADIRMAGGETQQVRKAFHDDNGCARSFPLFPLRCARNSNMCISREQICDGLGQCPDYNDEVECGELAVNSRPRVTWSFVQFKSLHRYHSKNVSCQFSIIQQRFTAQL